MLREADTSKKTELEELRAAVEQARVELAGERTTAAALQAALDDAEGKNRGLQRMVEVARAAGGNEREGDDTGGDGVKRQRVVLQARAGDVADPAARPDGLGDCDARWEEEGSGEKEETAEDLSRMGKDDECKVTEREREREGKKGGKERAVDPSRMGEDSECKAMETALVEKDREIRDLLARLEACHEQHDRERRVGEAERAGREREEQVREEKEREREEEKEKDMTGLREEVSAVKIKEAELAAACAELQRELEAARATQEETKTREAKLEAACAELQRELEAARAVQEETKTREAELAAACSELEGEVGSMQAALTRQGQEAVRVQTELEASRAMVKQQADDDAARRERELQRDERQEADRLQVAALREHNDRLGEEVARLEADVSRLQERCAEEQARASKHEEECAALQSRQQEVWAGLRRDLDERVAHLEEQVCFAWIYSSGCLWGVFVGGLVAERW